MSLGRPNKGADHVDALDTDEATRERLRLLLWTLSSEVSVNDACDCLGISRARFKQIRKQGLQGAADALSPKPPGRRPKISEAAAKRIEALERELAELQRQLERERARSDLLEALAPAAEPKRWQRTARRSKPRR